MTFLSSLFFLASQSKIYTVDQERKLTEFKKIRTNILERLSEKEVSMLKKMFEKLKRGIYSNIFSNRFNNNTKFEEFSDDYNDNRIINSSIGFDDRYQTPYF